MSLLSTDIAKVKRLSLREVKLPTTERRVELREDIKPHPEPEIKAQEIDRPKLIALAQRVIEGNNSYLKEELIERIKETTKVNRERAERGFNLIFEAGILETIQGDRYYLTGSTPF